MKPNIGSIDRTLRGLIGMALITWGLISHNWLGAIGLVPLLTALIRFCPLYCPLGISTIGTKRKGGGCGCSDGKCD